MVGMGMTMEHEIELLIRARYPILYVLTSEELRLGRVLEAIASRRQKRLIEWTCTGGIVPHGTSVQSRQRSQATRDPMVALDQVLEQVEPAIFVFKDLHPWLGRDHPAVIRRLKDIALHLRNSLKTIVMVSPVLEIPVELEKEVSVLHLPLPSREELSELLDGIMSEVGSKARIAMDLDMVGRQRLVDACLGLTQTEAENVFARLLVEHGQITGDMIREVMAEKQQIIRKSGLLEYIPAAEGLESVGGMEALKRWVRERASALGEEARQFGLPPPRGLLLLGVQGCGKSLSAKAVAAEWQLPLLRFDLGRMFGSFVGASEENVRRAIAVAESIAPAVLWIDEIDKAFAGGAGGASDGGVGARVLGTLLTWMAEKVSPVFVVATANEIAHLPPELLRKGRLDEIFFVDLPTLPERREILEVHLRRRGRNAARFDLARHALQSEGYSGAELEQAVVSGLFRAFASHRELEDSDLGASLGEMIPLARTLSEALGHFRSWAANRARPASGPAE